VDEVRFVARVVNVNVRVDQKTNRLGVDLPDRRYHLVGDFSVLASTMKTPSGPASTPILPPVPSC
jgi:hypothetical protein